MHRGCALALVALLSSGLAGCGGTPASRPPEAAQHLLSRAPEVGVACPQANSIACDRVGLAVWLRRPAAGVTATIDGRSLRLRRPERRDGWYEGYLQPAGLLHGALRVTPDRGRYYWQGSHPKDAQVRVTIRRDDGSVERATRVVALRAGWG